MITYDHQRLYLIGFILAGRLGYLFVQESVPESRFISYSQAPDFLSDLLPWN
jgi:hypothetical protein